MEPEQPQRRKLIERFPPTAQRAYHDLCIAAKDFIPLWHRTKSHCKEAWKIVVGDAKESRQGSVPDTVTHLTEKACGKAGKGKEWAKEKWEKAAPKIKESCKIVADDAKQMEGKPLEKAKDVAHKAMDGVEKCCHKCTDKVRELVGHKSNGDDK